MCWWGRATLGLEDSASIVEDIFTVLDRDGDGTIEWLERCWGVWGSTRLSLDLAVVYTTVGRSVERATLLSCITVCKSEAFDLVDCVNNILYSRVNRGPWGVAS